MGLPHQSPAFLLGAGSSHDPDSALLLDTNIQVRSSCLSLHQDAAILASALLWDIRKTGVALCEASCGCATPSLHRAASVDDVECRHSVSRPHGKAKGGPWCLL